MKIVLLGAYGLAEGYKGLADALVRRGIEVEFIGLSAVLSDYRHEKKMNSRQAILMLNKELPDMVSEFNPDAILLWKGCEVLPSTCKAIKDKGIKVLYFSWDDPFYITNARSSINTIQSCPYIDLAFTSCQDTIPIYKKFGCQNTHLLWPGFDPRYHKPAIYLNDEEKNKFAADTSFVATNTYHRRFYPQTTGCRIDIVQSLINSKIDVKLWGFGKEMFGWLSPVYGDPSLANRLCGRIPYDDNHKVFSGSKVNLNSHPIWGKYYLNERTFQILGSGGFMMCDAVTGIDQIFRPGIHIEIFYSLDDLIQKTRLYLQDEDRRYSIAARGMKHAYENHTWDHRAQVFERELNKL